ncbi:MAG: hypothetical protein APR62_02180 [Smithella sp. SDB]|nr:MAG: hypothetical protein APR62_02180 [Smithella sp. SDB]
MKVLNEKGEVYLRDKFISPRLIKDALEKKFNVKVIDERHDYIKFKIIRLARIYGAPFIWPQATIEIWIENENDKLIYEFFWPEYLALIIPFILFIVVEENLKDFIFFFIVAIIFFGGLMFLDTRWVSRRILTAFKNI